MGERLGLKVPDGETRARLQRLEQRHGTHNVKQWAAEGMKVETMGLPPDMQEFRERQAQRSAEIPYDIERQNKHSEQRSEEAVQRMGPAGETGVPDSVRDVISSSGQSLDGSIQRAMEERMGDSLGDVRVHTGPQAASACDEINARAFTVGNHVAFNSGEYDPESPEGQHVLAHELAHVRQQTGADVSMLPQEGVGLEIDPDPALEREAEETAQQVMEGGELGIQRMSDSEVHVQRSVKGAISSVKEKLPGVSNDGEESQFKELNDGDLSETVEKLVENQRQIMSHIEGQQRGMMDKVGEATGKGVVGGAVGLGVGVATQNPVMGALAGGAAGDVAKTMYGSVYQPGKEAMTDVADAGVEKLGGIKDSITDYIDKKIEERFGGSENIVDSQGVGSSGEVTKE
jgi:hypothetical protein